MSAAENLVNDHMLVVFFIYGLAFFSLGMTILLRHDRQYNLPIEHSLWFLAGFGLLHGCSEWSDMFLTLGETYWTPLGVKSIRAVGLYLNEVSFILLLGFGLKYLALRKTGRRPPPFALPVAALVLLAGVTVYGIRMNWSSHWHLLSNVLVRYALAFPSACLACVSFLGYSTSSEIQKLGSPRVIHSMKWMAVVFALYALLAGVVVPQAAFPPATFINYTSFETKVGFPVQVFRAACALLGAFYVGGVLATFSVASYGRLQAEIVERKRVEAELKVARDAALKSSLQDPLTKLPNRRLFDDRLTVSLKRAERRPGYLCAVLYLDLDHFKNINDSLGHQAGDELLVEVANRLQASLRRTDAISHFPGGEDLIARLGGDEFAILLDEIKDISDALRVADRISERLHAPVRVRGKDLFVTVSIGIATSTSRYPTAETMLRDADTAMYRVKATGRPGRVVFDEGMHSRAVERLHLESELRRAVDRKEFTVHYQPIVSLPDEHIVGVEALLRWRSLQLDLAGPDIFIPVAEEIGLIIPLGAWVLQEACVQLRRWQERFGREPLLTMTVNLSAKQFFQPDLVSMVARILNETGVEGRCLRLELTESVAMEKPELTCHMLEELQHLGVRLSIDDFGTGYSSLDHLHRLSVDSLKIDRHFVARMEADERNQKIVNTIISLAHNLQMDVIAEGVETAEHVSLLSGMNCDCVQGYFFSKPLEAAKLETLLEKQCAIATNRDAARLFPR